MPVCKFSANPQPELTVNPSTIIETDSVMLSCQTPSTVYVHQCFFNIGNQERVKGIACEKTLTGTELLKMTHQRSPAVVKAACLYTVRLGGSDSPSRYSETSSITINSE